MIGTLERGRNRKDSIVSKVEHRKIMYATITLIFRYSSLGDLYVLFAATFNKICEQAEIKIDTKSNNKDQSI